MSRSQTPPSTSTAHASLERATSPAGLPSQVSADLCLIKAAVRAQAAYTLATAPSAARKLNQNESPYDFPAELKREVLQQAAGIEWQRYPDFAPADLLARLAEYYRWAPEGVLVGNGSNELIQATLAVSLDSSSVVVAPSPTFSLYRLLTAVFGGTFVPVPLGADFSYDVDGIIAAALRERARVIVVNSPNNPTGSALPDGAVERMLEETEALVVCDEAYQDFGGPTAIPLLERSSRLVVLRTFSKALGLAGLRFGVALAHPAVAREITKAKLPYNVNAITLTAARVALKNAETLTSRTREIIATRERFVTRLREVAGITAFPSAGNFVLLRIEGMPAKELFRRLLDDYGILVRDVSDGPGLAGCLRISVGTAEDMDAVIEALKQLLGDKT